MGWTKWSEIEDHHIEVEEEFSTTKDLVESVLRDHEEARNSDLFLLWYIWRRDM